jgi:hypothetical protein
VLGQGFRGLAAQFAKVLPCLPQIIGVVLAHVSRPFLCRCLPGAYLRRFAAIGFRALVPLEGYHPQATQTQ